MNEIPHDKEIIHIPHLNDGGKLVLKALLCRFIIACVAGGKTFFAQAAEHLFRRFACFNGKARQVNGMKVKIDLAAAGDFLRALNRVLVPLEQRLHLVFAFDVQLARVHTHAGIVIQRFARLDAHQHFLRVGIAFRQIVAVVGRNERHACFFRDFDQPRQHDFFIRDAMIHDLNIEMIFTHHGAHTGNIVFRIAVAPIQQHPGQIARKAGG